jgi:hypothetical protein
MSACLLSGTGDETVNDETIPRALVEEHHTAAQLAVARITSGHDDNFEDYELLPYYEGRLDALHALLVDASVAGHPQERKTT